MARNSSLPGGIWMLPLAWQLTRPPRVLEPNLPGVFAVGDVRSGECDALASAVGEEAIAIHLVHWALAEF